jgi:hypothetical protein
MIFSIGVTCIVVAILLIWLAEALQAPQNEARSLLDRMEHGPLPPNRVHLAAMFVGLIGVLAVILSALILAARWMP